MIKDYIKLSNRAEEIDIFEEKGRVESIVEKLKKAMDSNKKLELLTAPQIGINVRIFCLRFKGDDVRFFVDPQIRHTKDLQLFREKSVVTNKEYICPRHASIMVSYVTPEDDVKHDRFGKIEMDKFVDGTAAVFERAVNLLDGVLVEDFGLEVLPEFDKAPVEEQEQVVNCYLDNLKLNNKEAKEYIDNTPLLKSMKDKERLLVAVINGEVNLEKIK